MAKIAYLDCISGISGDMTLGALVDAGVELPVLQAGIDSMELPSCQLVAKEVKRKGFRATKVHVEHDPEYAHRHLHHITDMIDASRLSDAQKDLAKRIFTRLGEVEAKVHGTTIRKVHFHEVGAVDSIVDIVGAAIGWDLLNLDRIVCSPVPTGHGTIKIAHGRCSVPAPATAELLKGVPIAPSVVEAELTTPTGAAIVSTVCQEFGQLPAMSIQTIGCGAGDRDFEEQGNILRLMVGTDASQTEQDRITVLETNLDNVPGETVGYCLERLLKHRALDVYTTPILMKKNRPAVKVTVLCNREDAAVLETILFSETNTLGVRRWETERTKLPREQSKVETQWGSISGKVVHLPDGQKHFSPEHDACRSVAEAEQIPLSRVVDVACRAFKT